MSIEIIVLRFVHRKSKNLLSLVPFSIIFLVEFCVTIYSIFHFGIFGISLGVRTTRFRNAEFKAGLGVLF